MPTAGPTPRGIDFYKCLADRLGERGIHAFVTLYHWGLPQHLEDRGDWLNRETAYRFADYADLMSRELAGRVSAWATHNEPWCAGDMHIIARPIDYLGLNFYSRAVLRAKGEHDFE
jgi:beta-glucosidase